MLAEERIAQTVFRGDDGVRELLVFGELLNEREDCRQVGRLGESKFCGVWLVIHRKSPTWCNRFVAGVRSLQGINRREIRPTIWRRRLVPFPERHAIPPNSKGTPAGMAWIRAPC
jgi:hypothetical protein